MQSDVKPGVPVLGTLKIPAGLPWRVCQYMTATLLQEDLARRGGDLLHP
jgi:hypothetical protein